MPVYFEDEFQNEPNQRRKNSIFEITRSYQSDKASSRWLLLGVQSVFKWTARKNLPWNIYFFFIWLLGSDLWADFSYCRTQGTKLWTLRTKELKSLSWIQEKNLEVNTIKRLRPILDIYQGAKPIKNSCRVQIKFLVVI